MLEGGIERQIALAREAQRLRSAGAYLVEIITRLHTLNQRCVPPLSEPELLRLAEGRGAAPPSPAEANARAAAHWGEPSMLVAHGWKAGLAEARRTQRPKDMARRSAASQVRIERGEQLRERVRAEYLALLVRHPSITRATAARLIAPRVIRSTKRVAAILAGLRT